MATVRRPTTLQRPVPGPAGAASTRDYTQPPPGGTHYPWEPGGGSKVPGVPDNWSDFYPNVQEGRGDAWIGPKKAQLNAEHPPSSYQNMPSKRSSMSPQDFAQWQGQQLPQDAAAIANRNAMHNPMDVRSPTPNWPDLAIARQNQNQQKYNDYRAAHGMPPISPHYTGKTGPLTYQPGGPIPPAAGGPGGGASKTGAGSAQAWQRLGAAQQQKTAAPAAAPDYAKIRSGMKAGQTQKIGGKSYFLNQNGALVDVTDPRAKKRITDRQGKLIGQAAAPPPPGTTPPGTTPPPTTAPPGGRVPIGNQPPPTTPGGDVPRGVPPAQQPPPQQQYPPVTQQPQQQYDPYSLNQFGYPQNQGPGPYGWNPGYGESPFDYSNVSNAIMQGMGGGYGMPQMTGNEMGYYGPTSQFMQGGYGWPEQNMGGYGGMDQLMGYNAGMDPYGMGQSMMGYY